ncbi:MAG TPA: hypothetical protein VMP11_16725 [Verrucomicrobiae bacterium]|nr:hypothetical protein [Verrucomicrobiae bacterium]
MNVASSNAVARQTGSSRFRLPSLAAALWVILFLGLSFTSARIVLISGDSDPALHRRLGDWMIQHRAIVREDNLLHTYHGQSMAKEWLSQILMAAAGRCLGWNGVVLLAAALVATCFWMLHRQLLEEGSDPATATVLVLVAMFACSMHWLARPLLFTHLFTVVFAWQLRWFQQGRISAHRLLWLLPPLMVLWANLHGAFPTGLVLIAMYTVGTTIDSRRQSASGAKLKPLVVLFLVCCAAILINPDGWRLPAQIASFLRSRELSTVTTEFASPNFHTVGMHGFLLMLLLLAAGLIVIRPKVSVMDLLLIGGWGYFSLLSARNVPIFALVVTPILAQWFAEFTRARQDSAWVRRYREWTAGLSCDGGWADAAIILTAAFIALGVMAKPILVGGAPLIVTDYPPGRYPVAALDYLREHPDAVRGEMFNYFLWGGYIEFALPQHKPFIDSRNYSYGIDLFHEFRSADEPKPGWEKVFAKYHVGWTILPVQHPLNQILELSSGWTRVYSNQLTLVFSRVS